MAIAASVLLALPALALGPETFDSFNVESPLTDANTPNDCAVSPAIDRCPSISRNRTGTIGFRAFVSRSGVGSDSVLPFYFQQTLGGSDLNGSRMLASYDDYRFRGPHVFFLQESIEHSLGTWPVGLWFAADQGRVSLFDDDGDSGDVRYSVSSGLTLRAGGFPVAVLSLGTGGSEGSHVAFTISTSLLGGSPRPSLHLSERFKNVVKPTTK